MESQAKSKTGESRDPSEYGELYSKPVPPTGGPSLLMGRADTAARHIEAGSHQAVRYRRLIFGFDLLAIALASAVALWIGQESGRISNPWPLVIAVLVASPVWALLAYATGQYHDFERRVTGNLFGDSLTLAVVSTGWIWIFLLLRAWFSDGVTDLLSATVLWLGLLALVPTGRVASRRIANRSGWTVQKVSIIGDRPAVLGLVEKIERHPEWHLRVGLLLEISLLTDRDTTSADGVHGSVIRYPEGSSSDDWTGQSLEGADEIIRELVNLDTRRVVIAGGFSGYRNLDSRTRFLQKLLLRGFTVDLLSGGPELVYSRSLVHDYEGVPILTFKPTQRRRLSLAFKRVSDVVMAGIGLAVFSPVIAWAAICIKRDSAGPVFFRQTRRGQGGRDFEILKLRTMVDGADAMRVSLKEAALEQGNDMVLFKLEDDPRLTSFGRRLRVWSLDEIPQLWNVLRGEMSMVGPRPLPLDEAAVADQVFPVRTSVKPGIAGSWQANGRSGIPFEDMIRLDFADILGASTLEDFRLLFRTAIAVVRRQGAV